MSLPLSGQLGSAQLGAAELGQLASGIVLVTFPLVAGGEGKPVEEPKKKKKKRKPKIPKLRLAVPAVAAESLPERPKPAIVPGLDIPLKLDEAIATAIADATVQFALQKQIAEEDELLLLVV